ncbi:hypothetical protein NG749_00870 [Aliarcobacter cryaerophilus]|uniref:DUF3226 domain-containing protein n=1 Tax=Aliarcobacter cryaerophilus TaxID=28198 RepID=UPI003DA545D5
MSSLIIVESDNDKYFIEKLKDKLGLSNIAVDQPICNMKDIECLNGLSETKLISTLKEIRYDKWKKVGIILDADNVGIEERIKLINKCIKSLDNVPSDFEITKINEFIEITSLDIQICCYITNISGKGELETVLRHIKSVDSPHADCLESWRACLNSKGKVIKDKDFDKFWVNNYLRFDTCSKEEQKQSSLKCRNEIAIKKDIWDLNNEILSELKTFLELLSS